MTGQQWIISLINVIIALANAGLISKHIYDTREPIPAEPWPPAEPVPSKLAANAAYGQEPVSPYPAALAYNANRYGGDPSWVYERPAPVAEPPVRVELPPVLYSPPQSRVSSLA